MKLKEELFLPIHDDLMQLSPELEQNFSGRYYTPNKMALNLIYGFISKQKQLKKAPTTIRVIDPFAGDGRLVRWLIEVYSASITPNVNWEVTLWDVHQDGLITAEKEFQNLEFSDRVSLKISQGDAFVKAINDDGKAYLNQFDVVITNPPWEVIKPDHRQIKKISCSEERKKIVSKLKLYDQFLESNYPLSQPETKFAGWGTDLSRVGLELCFKLLKSTGYIAIVLPNSFLADHKSRKIRKHVLLSAKLRKLSVYPAEARLFEGADVGAICCLFEKVATTKQTFELELFDKANTSR